MNHLGAVCDLLIRAGVYTDWTLERVHRQFSHPVALGQAMIFRTEGQPVGVVTWAFVSDEVLTDLMKGERGVAPHEWRCGGNLFFADFVAPYGHAPNMMRQVRGKFRDILGKGVRGHWFRRAKGRAGHVGS